MNECIVIYVTVNLVIGCHLGQKKKLATFQRTWICVKGPKIRFSVPIFHTMAEAHSPKGGVLFYFNPETIDSVHKSFLLQHMEPEQDI